MLAFKNEVQAEFEKILSAKIKNNLSDAALGKLIQAVVQMKMYRIIPLKLLR